MPDIDPIDPQTEHNRQLVEQIKDGTQALSHQAAPVAPTGGPSTDQPTANQPRQPFWRRRPQGSQLAKDALDLTTRMAKMALKKVLSAITSPFWLTGLGLVLLVVVLLSVALVVVALSGQNGGGPDIKPSTVEQKFAAVQLLALSDDPGAKTEVIISGSKKIKEKLSVISKTAEKKYSADKLTGLKAQISEINTLLDQVINEASNVTSRAALIIKVNERLNAFQAAYPEMFFNPGSCADLKPFIDNKQFQVLSGPNGALIVKGQMMNSDRQIWPASQDLCGALVAAFRAGFKITTGTLSYGHARGTATGNVSRHYCAAAIDISAVNNERVTTTSTSTLELVKFLNEASKAGSIYIGELILPNTYNQYEMKNNRPQVFAYDISAKDHETHIHLSGRVEDVRCRK